MDKKRLHYATLAFIGEMRRQSVQQGKEDAVKQLDQYPAEQQAALTKAIGRALDAASPAADKAFQAWLVKNLHKHQ